VVRDSELDGAPWWRASWRFIVRHGSNDYDGIASSQCKKLVLIRVGSARIVST
jgi:hypothetical protein